MVTASQTNDIGRSSTRSPSSDPTDSGLGFSSPHAVVGLLCAGLIAAGILLRDELDVSAADGLGYALGIVGLSAMTILLGYSLRKRFKWLRRAGPLRKWFELHLILGLIGPTAILYHAGFELGSMNSTISLACVLAVSGSGVGGRYLYGRMHRTLAGPRRTVANYTRSAVAALKPIESVLERVPAARQEIDAFASTATTDPSLFTLPFRAATMRLRSLRVKRRVLRSIRDSARPHVVAPAVREAISEFFSELNRGVELRLFEKLFALWHAIHVPLTVILFISAAIHVVAVHLY